MKGPKVRVEEVEVTGEMLLATIRELVHPGNVRRIVIRNAKGVTLLEIPLVLGIAGAVFAPVWAAIGALAALVAKLDSRHREGPGRTGRPIDRRGCRAGIETGPQGGRPQALREGLRRPFALAVSRPADAGPSAPSDLAGHTISRGRESANESRRWKDLCTRRVTGLPARSPPGRTGLPETIGPLGSRPSSSSTTTWTSSSS